MFLVIAAVVDKLYISEAIQIPVITGLIVATFGMIILSIPLVAYYARGDNYLEGHIPQRDEPIDLPFHGGRVVETALNYDPDSKSDLEAIESGDLIPRHDIPLYLTEDKIFPIFSPSSTSWGSRRSARSTYDITSISRIVST